MKPNLFITGGSGLLALNWAAVMRDRFVVTLGMHKSQVGLQGVKTVSLNLESTTEILTAFEQIRPQLVIHTAGLTSVEKCEADPKLAHHVNVELTQNLAQVCAQLSVPMVHISTDHLFSGKLPWLDEMQAVVPLNVYAGTKAEGELRVLASGPQVMVVRTNFYGWGPSYRQSFSDWIITSLRNGNSVTLFEDAFYTPIVIEALINAVHELVSRSASGIFHVVGDERISKHQFGLKIAERFQLNAELIRAGKLVDQHALTLRPRDMSLSNAKTCRAIGRTLGGVDEHLQLLLRQYQTGLAEELQNL